VKTEEEVYRFGVDKITEYLGWQRELKEQGAVPKSVYFNFVIDRICRFAWTKTTKWPV